MLLREVLAFYEAVRRGQSLHLEQPRPYRDYITWLRRRDLASAEASWRKALAGFTAPTPLRLNTEPERVPRGEDGRGGGGHGEQQIGVSTATTAALQSLARQHRLTLNTLAGGAWAVLLSRCSGQEDVVFGATVSGRPAAMPGVESIVGPFINTLPVRVRVDPASSLMSWLKGLQDQQTELRQYEHTPLDRAQEWSEIPRGLPLFESILRFQNYPVGVSPQERMRSLEIRDVRFRDTWHYPLSVVVVPGAELLLSITYDRRRFDAAGVARTLEDLKSTLEAMAADPQQRLSDLLHSDPLHSVEVRPR